MNESGEYDRFLSQLRRLTFCRVENVLKRRESLISFRSRTGARMTSDSPWFGQAYADLQPNDLVSAELIYGYYCGHADGVFYRKPTKSDKRECFIPALRTLLTRRTLPVIGELIFGYIDEFGPEGRRFFWWNFATMQDKHFADLLLGRETFSAGKIEKKLVISDATQTNWSLFLLAKAIHFRDVGYFADLIRRKGFDMRDLGLNEPLDDWFLRRRIQYLVPEFWREFRRIITPL
jgi:hypothetical protein